MSLGGGATAQTPFLEIEYSSGTDSVNVITIIKKIDPSDEQQSVTSRWKNVQTAMKPLSQSTCAKIRPRMLFVFKQGS